MDSIPLFWQWFSVVMGFVGLVALILAIPAFVWMLVGKPKVEIDYLERKADSWKELRVGIRNRPIDSRFLRTLGIYRRDAYITPLGIVCTSGTNAPVAEPVWIGPAGEGAAYHLPQGRAAREHTVVRSIESGGNVVTNPFGQSVNIPRGFYDFNIVVFEGDQIPTFKRSFAVGDNSDSLSWLGPPSKRSVR